MEINNLVTKIKKSTGKLVTFQNGKRVEYLFSELFPMVQNAAFCLKQKGYGSQTTLGIISNNDLGWVITDLACIYCGIKLLPLEINFEISQYHNLNLTDVLVSDHFFDIIQKDVNSDVNFVMISELISNDFTEVSIDFSAAIYDSKDVFSFKSTSGSTGIPKIIGQTVESVENSIQGSQKLFNHTKEDRLLVFLPLNLLQQRYWLYTAIYHEHTVIIVPKEYLFIALKTERPTVVMGVPYVYEFIHDDFKSMLKRNAKLNEQYINYLNKGDFSKGFQQFNEYLGGNIRYLWTGSAPISKELVAFYFDMNLPLYQGYGMNETCIISKNYPSNNKIGSVGKIFYNTEVKFDENNQILVKSKFPVCKKYAVASEEENKQTFLNEGYIATGDIGYIDEEGYLFINGRIKEMIVLSSSKKIIPRSIEEKLMLHPEIKFCVLHGDNKPYLTALIIPMTNKISYENIERLVKNYNENCKSDEQIFKFFLKYDDFTEKNGLLTNQNKIKRQNIFKKYQSEFEEFYK